MTAYTLQEAKEWFLNNSYGSLPCHHHGVRKECHSFAEAERFFRGDSSYSDETRSDDDSSSILGLGIGLAASSLFDSSSSDSSSFDTGSTDSTPDTSSSFDSGGGDFGGGGGGSDF